MDSIKDREMFLYMKNRAYKNQSVYASSTQDTGFFNHLQIFVMTSTFAHIQIHACCSDNFLVIILWSTNQMSHGVRASNLTNTIVSRLIRLPSIKILRLLST
ncbi:unnamed protein product [Schistosoma rodhaini]|uniref:Uncharacterized protein n=1 Tax=Schistosoma rodhaini TaxID=6188 RepID=A0AA85FEL9_9TREM|nr:unnamed protein product [Schistosoma rodhaini]